MGEQKQGYKEHKEKREGTRECGIEMKDYTKVIYGKGKRKEKTYGAVNTEGVDDENETTK